MRDDMSKSRTVTISTSKLVAELKANRDMHIEEYRQALIDYNAAAQVYGGMLAELGENIELDYKPLPGKEVKKLDISAVLRKRPSFPQSYAKSYDEAIELFSWEEAATVHLTVSEFRRYVLNEWDWQDTFKAVTHSLSQA